MKSRARIFEIECPGCRGMFKFAVRSGTLTIVPMPPFDEMRKSTNGQFICINCKTILFKSELLKKENA